MAAAQAFIGKNLLPDPTHQTIYTLQAEYVADSDPEDTKVTVHYMLKKPGATGSNHETDYYEAPEYEQILYNVSGTPSGTADGSTWTPNDWDDVLDVATPIGGYVLEDKEGKVRSITEYIPLYVTIDNCHFVRCKTNKRNGGAIRSMANKTTIKNGCTFTACTATTGGGAIYMEGVTADVENATFISCTAVDGGAVYMKGTENANITTTTVSASGSMFIQCQASGNGGAVYMAGSKTESTVEGSTFIQCKASSGGGAVYVKGAVSADTADTKDQTIHTSKFVECTANNGGAYYVETGKLQLNSGTVNLNSSILHCAASSNGCGGGIYVKRGASVYLYDDSFISANTAKDGAGIYLEEGAKMYFQGSPGFGGPGVMPDGSIYAIEEGTTDIPYSLTINGTTVNLTGKTLRRYYLDNNKVKQYPDGDKYYMWRGADLYEVDSSGNITNTEPVEGGIPDIGNFSSKPVGKTQNGFKPCDKLRQDIYIAGYEDKAQANSLRLTGQIGSGDGSIWVSSAPGTSVTHHKQNDQFAIYEGFTPDEDTLKAFRNARDDTETENATETFLHAETTDDASDKNLYWNGSKGSRRVIIRKVREGSYEPVKGAEFDAYKGTNAAVIQVENGSAVKVPFHNLPSGDSGVIWIGELTYGTYFLNETSPVDKWFFLIVDDLHALMSGAYGSREAAKNVADQYKAALQVVNGDKSETEAGEGLKDEQKAGLHEMIALLRS